jgi:exodeoxyribonuclease VII large subunit
MTDSMIPFAQPQTPRAEPPLSVGEFTRRLRQIVEKQFAEVHVEGEISNLRPAASGHVYFVLKDDRAMVNCVLWASDVARLRVALNDGDQVEIRGRVTVYEPRGQYQIVVSSVTPAGLGRLHLQFQRLKERLEREGLFDPARKRPIPRFPRRVGVVTSPTGAAVRDILKVLSRRAPQIEVFIYPVRVQGEGAAAEIAHAIQRMNALKIAEVLIVGRGGGSLEDLWAFNEEVVARAIHQSAIPVISAVGHEVDFTIADFVADLRAPTPSAAAEIVSAHRAELLRELGHLKSRLEAGLQRQTHFLRQAPHLRARLFAAMRPRIGLLRERLRRCGESLELARPLRRVNEMRQRIDDFHARLHAALRAHQQAALARADRLSAQLQALNPRAILSRGYSITFDGRTHAIVRQARTVKPGTPLRIVLHEGEIAATATGVPPVPQPPAAPRRRPAGHNDQPEWFGLADPSEGPGPSSRR